MKHAPLAKVYRIFSNVRIYIHMQLSTAIYFTAVSFPRNGGKKPAITEVADTCRMIQPILKNTYVPYMYSLY